MFKGENILEQYNIHFHFLTFTSFKIISFGVNFIDAAEKLCK